MAKKSKKREAVKKETHSISQTQFQSTQPLKKETKDDLDVVYQTPPLPPPPIEEVNPSIISRVSSYVAKKVEPVVNLGTQVSESKYGKILLGSAVSRATTALFSAGLLAELWPPAIPLAVTGAVASITAVGASAIVDTLRTRSLRKLAEESDLLVKNRTALSKQEYILQNLNPELSEILKEQLHRPNLQQQDNNYSVSTEKALNAGQMMFDSVPVAANFAVNTMVASSSGSPMDILNAIRTGATTASTLIAGGIGAKYMVDVAQALKLHISQERQYVGEYNNTEELRQNVERQEIQTIALQELVQDRDFQRSKLTPEQTQEKFEHLTAKVERYYMLPAEEQQEQFSELAKKYQIQESHIANDSILSDLGRAHDPFYVQPVLKPDSELTKALVSEKAQESAKSIVTPEVREHLVPIKKSKHEVSQESFDKFGSVSTEGLAKRKKEASYLDLAEIHADKVKTQPQKSKPAEKGIAR